MTVRLLAVAAFADLHQASYLRTLAGLPELDLEVVYALPPARDDARFAGFSWGEVEDVHRVGDGREGFAALAAPKFHRQLERARPDVLLALGWRVKVLVQAARAARRKGLPVLLREASNDLLRRSWWQRQRLRFRLRNFSAFLAVGGANRRLYERAGVPERRIFAAPNVVDNGAFAEAAERLRPRRQELRRAWSVAGDDLCVLFAGAFEAKKRLFDLLDAVERARRTRSGLRLVMAGEGELDAALRARARERRLPVTFAGALGAGEMPRAYAAADVLVLPSDAHETWGLEVNEAMASGLPAVVSDRVGCREDLVIDGETGFSFRMGDVAGLAACLTTLADDPERAAAMGEAARERVVAGYSVARAVEGTLAAVSSVLRREAVAG
jgi:glycosyltransferase involved in cell wall biosynthesis